MRKRDNYFEEIERAAGQALMAVGYGGPGAVSERHLTDLAGYFGFTIITTGPIGKPLDKAVSGFRIVTVNGDKINQQWYSLADVPNQVETK